jgi:hypothetical protein
MARGVETIDVADCGSDSVRSLDMHDPSYFGVTSSCLVESLFEVDE